MSTTRSFDAPGATIAYDVHGESDGSTPLLLIGSPMSADGFTTLASHFTDRQVVTYDPRGVGRSPRTDGRGKPSRASTPMICIGWPQNSASARSTCSPAAGERSTGWTGWRAIRATSARWWRTSRRWPSFCPTATRCWPPARRSVRSTTSAAWDRRWRNLDIEAVRRSAASVAQALGTELVMFPSHHAGFLGGEFGMAGEPEAFAARLREVLPAR